MPTNTDVLAGLLARSSATLRTATVVSPTTVRLGNVVLSAFALVGTMPASGTVQVIRSGRKAVVFGVASGGSGGTANTVRSGARDPVAGDGINGDFWINTVSHFIFGPKAGGVWPAGTSMVGPAGAPGAAGATGPAGAAGAPGTPGSKWYIAGLPYQNYGDVPSPREGDCFLYSVPAPGANLITKAWDTPAHLAAWDISWSGAVTFACVGGNGLVTVGAGVNPQQFFTTLHPDIFNAVTAPGRTYQAHFQARLASGAIGASAFMYGISNTAPGIPDFNVAGVIYANSNITQLTNVFQTLTFDFAIPAGDDRASIYFCLQSAIAGSTIEMTAPVVAPVAGVAGDFYQYLSGVWTFGGSMRGPQGPVSQFPNYNSLYGG
jgi:hypothetical protein